MMLSSTRILPLRHTKREYAAGAGGADSSAGLMWLICLGELDPMRLSRHIRSFSRRGLFVGSSKT